MSQNMKKKNDILRESNGKTEDITFTKYILLRKV